MDGYTLVWIAFILRALEAQQVWWKPLWWFLPTDIGVIFLLVTGYIIGLNREYDRGYNRGQTLGILEGKIEGIERVQEIIKEVKEKDEKEKAARPPCPGCQNIRENNFPFTSHNYVGSKIEGNFIDTEGCGVVQEGEEFLRIKFCPVCSEEIQ